MYFKYCGILLIYMLLGLVLSFPFKSILKNQYRNDFTIFVFVTPLLVLLGNFSGDKLSLQISGEKSITGVVLSHSFN